jgi:hypothetical protein
MRDKLSSDDEKPGEWNYATLRIRAVLLYAGRTTKATFDNALGVLTERAKRETYEAKEYRGKPDGRDRCVRTHYILKCS